MLWPPMPDGMANGELSAAKGDWAGSGAAAAAAGAAAGGGEAGAPEPRTR